MSKTFYNKSDRFPTVVRAGVTRILLYIAETLYPEEFQKDPNLAAKRILISDIQAGPEFQIRDAIKTFQTFSANFPFTAYSINDFDEGDIKNFTAHSGKVFSEDIGRKIALYQRVYTIPMISFFAKASDFQRAMTALRFANATLTRLDVPITINKIAQDLHPYPGNLSYDTTFPVDINIEISKGSFAYEFQKYLTDNKIWDIQHNIKVKYYDFALSEYLGNMTIEQMILKLSELRDDRTKDLNAQVTINTPTLPYVISTTPANLSTSVPITTSSIQIVFNNSMKENDTEFKIEIDPIAPYGVSDIEWSLDSKTLTYNLYGDLTSATEYTVYVPRDKVVDMFGNHPENDYITTFTTA